MQRIIITSVARCALAWSCALGVAACRDGASGDGGDDDGTADDGSGGSDESGGDDGGACEVAPARVGLQRLTRTEYDRTVRDLFGVTSNPAQSFPPDSATNGFDNNAKSLTISPQLAALLLDASEAVAAEAIANDDGTIVSCDPTAQPDCAREILAAQALRVYRRPATTEEIDDLVAIVELTQSEGDTFAQGIENAIAAMLMAPQFLYRSIPADDGAPLAPGDIVALDDWALATRLSYFLWGSTPDDALLARAGAGELHDSEALRAEFDRMLADEKAEALYDGFFSQWLQLGKLAAATPDPAAFPGFTEELRAQMIEETRMFFASIRERDASMMEVVNGTQTFANATLAEIYGVEGPTGTALEPITTDPTQRAGMLTMPAILTMTSGPLEPNIVKRGVWLAETILCASPPPPPEGVPPPPDPQPGETERERLERHREDPSCASCHDLIDPLGFAFEHYDALGSWREEAEGVPVDDLGQLPDGRTFNGVVALAELLADGSEYPTCVSSKAMTYALGRTLTGLEGCVLVEIAADAVTPESTFSDLLWAIVTSDSFQKEAVEP